MAALKVSLKAKIHFNVRINVFINRMVYGFIRVIVLLIRAHSKIHITRMDVVNPVLSVCVSKALEINYLEIVLSAKAEKTNIIVKVHI